MARKLVKALAQRVHSKRHKWYFSMFGERLTDPHLWRLNRHAITAGFGVGVAVSFVPLPVHLELVVLLAIWWRLNVAAAVVGSWLVNPFTMVPIYYAAYRVGAALLRFRPQHFHFHLSWNWLEHGLGPSWSPFLLGCLVCGLASGLASRYILEYSWRVATMRRYRRRQRLRQRPQHDVRAAG